MDKISIIIPAYNVEEYIKQCLDSLLNQNYNNIEIIVIDDGSQDGTGDICDKYSERHNKIKVVHKKNEGVSAARNLGLSLATGEYISFVDADDTVDPQIYSLCMHEFKDKEADIVIIMSNRIDENGIRQNNSCELTGEKLSQTDAVRHLVNGDKFGCACYSKIFKRSVIGEERFNTELAINEDFLFCFYCFLRAKNIYFTGRYLYNYRKRRDSVTSEAFNEKKFDSITAAREMLEFCRNNRSDLVDISFKRLINVLVATYNKSLGYNRYDKNRLRIVEELRAERKTLYKNKELSVKDKIAVFLLTTNRPIYNKLYCIAYRTKVKE